MAERSCRSHPVTAETGMRVAVGRPPVLPTCSGYLIPVDAVSHLFPRLRFRSMRYRLSNRLTKRNETVTGEFQTHMCSSIIPKSSRRPSLCIMSIEEAEKCLPFFCRSNAFSLILGSGKKKQLRYCIHDYDTVTPDKRSRA